MQGPERRPKNPTLQELFQKDAIRNMECNTGPAQPAQEHVAQTLASKSETEGGGDGKAGQSAGTELRFFSTSGSFDRILRRDPEPSTAKVEGEKGKKDGQEHGQERYD